MRPLIRCVNGIAYMMIQTLRRAGSITIMYIMTTNSIMMMMITSS